MTAQETTSTRPYLIRALYEWCTENGLTPYVAVRVDDSVHVPYEYVKNGEIILNVSYDATSALQLGNDFIEFKARFGGKPREIRVPVGCVVAIYARENGQGMAFAPPSDRSASDFASPGPAPTDALPSQTRMVHLVSSDDNQGDDDPPRPPPIPGGTRPALKRVK